MALFSKAQWRGRSSYLSFSLAPIENQNINIGKKKVEVERDKNIVKETLLIFIY